MFVLCGLCFLQLLENLFGFADAPLVCFTASNRHSVEPGSLAVAGVARLRKPVLSMNQYLGLCAITHRRCRNSCAHTTRMLSWQCWLLFLSALGAQGLLQSLAYLTLLMISSLPQRFALPFRYVVSKMLLQTTLAAIPRQQRTNLAAHWARKLQSFLASIAELGLGDSPTLVIDEVRATVDSFVNFHAVCDHHFFGGVTLLGI